MHVSCLALYSTHLTPCLEGTFAMLIVISLEALSGNTFSVKDELSYKYDGASVNSRKKKFKFIFSTVFLPKQQKKYIKIYFLQRFSKNRRKNIFKYIFSYVFLKTAEKKYLNIFSPTFFQKQEKKYI